MHNGNGQMKGVINLQRRFVSYNRKNLTRWTRGFCLENIITCLEKYLEVSGMKNVLAEIKIVDSVAANSAVEESC